MSLMESLRVAWEALIGNKLRAVLTMLGIIIGVASVIAIVSIGRGATAAAANAFTSAFGPTTFRLFSAPISSKDGSKLLAPFTSDDIRRLRAGVPELKAISGAAGGRGPVKVGNQSESGGWSALSVEGLGILGINVSQGRPFTAEEDAAGERVAIIGSYWADRFFPGDEPVGQSIYLGGTAYRVIGVQAQFSAAAQLLSGGDANKSIYVPLGAVLKGQTRRYATIWASAVDQASVPVAVQNSLDVLQRAHPQAGYGTDSVANVLSTVSQVLGIITAVISAVAAISLLVGGIGIMNIMLVSVTERTREIGIRKAIGARRRDILRQFLIEACLICLIGGLLGLLLAALPLWVIGPLIGVPLPVGPDAVALGIGFSMVVGLAFGVYPANKAAKLDPIEALRYE